MKIRMFLAFAGAVVAVCILMQVFSAYRVEAEASQAIIIVDEVANAPAIKLTQSSNTSTKLDYTPAITFIWPITGAPDSPYLVGDAFGPRLNPDGYDWHRGIDIKGDNCDTVVVASTSGQVRISKDYDDRYPNCGKIIQIQYPNTQTLEYRTNYCHLCERWVEEGATVYQGQPIGLVGMISATWPHLHFEIRKGDKEQNPYCYLPHPDLDNHHIEINNVVTSSLPVSITVALTVTAPRDELDINEVRVRVLALDAGGDEVDNKYINFNERHNCGPDDECDECEMDGSTQICMDPQDFKTDTPTWEVGFTFSGLNASSLVQVLVEAKDCNERVYLPIIIKE
jgi:hypothetical protein